jgi:hypothetical protein
MVISGLLGVPMSDIPMFVAWSDDMIAAVGTGTSNSPDWPETWARVRIGRGSPLVIPAGADRPPSRSQTRHQILTRRGAAQQPDAP